MADVFQSARTRSLPIFFAVVAGSLSFGARSVEAQIPALGNASPRGAAPGTTTAVKLTGGNLQGATGLWTSFPAQVTLAPDIPQNGQNAGEVVYQLAIPADCPPGIHALRLRTATGTSNLLLFCVDELPSIAQVKPNESQPKAQAISWPCAVDGSVDPLGRNYYKFTVGAGQSLSFEVVARRLGSPLDPMLRLLDASGRELAFNDDPPGMSGDSQIRYTFANAGEYAVEVRDIRFQGGGNFHYRLRIGDFPLITTPYPLSVPRGATTNVTFAGAHVAGLEPVAVTVAADDPAEFRTIGARFPGNPISGFATIGISRTPEALETEPNNDAPSATRVELGSSINGRLETPGDVDHFVFTAKAGQRYLLRGITRQQGSPADLFLRLLKPDGGEIAAVDDSGAEEGVIDFNCPADGDYQLVVRDLSRRGDAQYAYRIAAEPFEPGFQLTASAHILNVPVKGTEAVVVTSVRRGYNGPIELSLEGAPEGVTATPAVIGPGLNQVVLTIENTGAAPADFIAPLKIVGTAQIGEKTVREAASVTGALRAALSGMPAPPPILQNGLGFGSTPTPFFVLNKDPATVVLGRNLFNTVKIVANKTDFNDVITLQVNPPQNGLPPGIALNVMPINKDQNEVTLTFSANAQAPLGRFSVALQGTAKKGNDTVVQHAPTILIELREPFALKSDFGDGKLARGGTLKGKVVATRNPAYNGPIAVTFAKLPAGVTASAATIPEGQTEVEVTLTAAADAAQGTVADVAANGEGTAGDQKLPGSSPPISLTVE